VTVDEDNLEGALAGPAAQAVGFVVAQVGAGVVFGVGEVAVAIRVTPQVVVDVAVAAPAFLGQERRTCSARASMPRNMSAGSVNIRSTS